MAQNNPANDAYNPPKVGTEFEDMIFEDIDQGDLIWMQNNSLDGQRNPAHKKVSDNAVVNIQTGQQINVTSRQKVYQKT